MGTQEHGVECTETLYRLYTYLDGELTEERRIEIKRHLDECPPCLHAYDFEIELRHVIAMRCKERVPEGLKERVQRAIREEGTHI